jgi:hypothetical protein
MLHDVPKEEVAVDYLKVELRITRRHFSLLDCWNDYNSALILGVYRVQFFNTDVRRLLTLGKTAGKDAKDGKTTYVKLHGLDASRRFANECTDRALAAIASLPGETGFLRTLATTMAKEHPGHFMTRLRCL